MSFSRPTALQMSVHEAGHAYCFALIMSGEIPIELGLEPMPGGFRGWSKRLKVAEADGVEIVLRELGEDGAHCWIATAEAAIALAGPLAEARQREGSSGGGLIFLSLAMPQLLEPAVPAIDHDFQRIRELLTWFPARVPWTPPELS